MKKRNATLIILSLLLFSFLANASAITGRLGNSRMVLTLDEGESTERYILIQNHNEVTLTIDLKAEGDLANSIKINDEEFTLGPGEEKKAYFKITASKPGTTETKINVRFTPEEGSGVGLSSTIIVVAPGENEEPTNSEEDNNIFSFSPEEKPTDSEGFSFTTWMIISTLFLVAIFAGLLIYSKSKKTEKRPGRPRA